MQDTQLKADLVSNEPDDEIDLLDLLVVIAENIKLLTVGPILVGVLALGFSFTLPQTFESVAILRGDDAMASTLQSATVLDPVITAFGLGEGKSAQLARMDLAEQIKSSVGRKDGLVTLTVQQETAEGAQKVANALIDSYLKTTIPWGGERQRLESRYARALIFSKQLEARLKTVLASGSNENVKTGSTLDVGPLIAATQSASTEVEVLELKLKGAVKSEFLVQAPTAPEVPIKPKKSLIAILAALATGFLLLLFVFLRNAWTQASRVPLVQPKLERIRRALSLHSTS